MVEPVDVQEEHEEHGGAKQEQSVLVAREGALEPEESVLEVAAVVLERERRTERAAPFPALECHQHRGPYSNDTSGTDRWRLH